MVELVSVSPCAGLLPRTIGQVKLTECVVDQMWSVAPLKGRRDAVDRALRPLELAFPDPGTVQIAGDARAIWAGQGTALVMTAALPDMSGLAAVTDQSDAWAVVAIEGPTAEAVLARLVPVDLRVDAFGVGRTARTLIGHMTGSVTRTGPEAFELMVMRSMSRTLVHELDRAATLYAGRP